MHRLAIAEGMVYVGSPDTYLHALDVETGQEKWRFNTKSGVASSPAVTEGGSFSVPYRQLPDTNHYWTEALRNSTLISAGPCSGS